MADYEYRSIKKQRQKPRRSRTHRVEVRLNDVELERLDAVAQARNMTRSDVLRFAAIASSGHPTEKVVRIDSPELVRVRQELNKQGVNLNQIARVYNKASRPPLTELDEFWGYQRTAEELEAVRQGLGSINDTMREALGAWGGDQS